MLAKKRRLKFSEIELIKKTGRYYSTPFFSLIYCKGSGISRFASVFSRKIDKRATVRNRAKRLLMGTVREMLEEIKEGYLFLFLAKRVIIGQEKDILRGAIIKAFGEINLLRQKSDLDVK